MPGGAPDAGMHTSVPGEAKRLPKLRPNVNKKAQQIIKAHMQSTLDGGSTGVSTATVPILTKLEGTAPRMARTHDISHLCDQPSCLCPSVPPTIISEEDHVYEKSFMAKDTSSVYRDEDGLWHTKIFPSEKPSSRMDAVMLDAWITRALNRHQEERATAASKDEFAKTVEDLVPILSIALHEIVRQVMHHCSERGLALERIWRTYVELFQRVLQQLQESIQHQKERTADAQTKLHEVTRELRALKKSHPEQMHRIISDLEVRFTQRQSGFEDELKLCEQENNVLKNQLRNQHRDAEMWYPGFINYQDSYIRNLIPQHTAKAARRASLAGQDGQTSSEARSQRRGMSAEDQPASEMPPEVAIAEDFKRLLTVFATDKRRLIGQELVDLIDGAEKEKKEEKVGGRRSSFNQAVLDEQQKDLDQLEELQKEVQAQEDRIRAIKQEILRIETAKAFGADDEDEGPESSSSSSEEDELKEEEQLGAGSNLLQRATISMVQNKDRVLVPGKRGSILHNKTKGDKPPMPQLVEPRDDDMSGDSESGLSEGGTDSDDQ